MTEIPFDAGHVFFHPGDPADRAYQVVDGHIEMLSGSARVTRRGPGEVFGEMSLIEEQPHRLLARAVTAGRCTSLTRDEFEHNLLADPTRCRHYLKSLFERLRAAASQPGAGEPAAALKTGPVALPSDAPGTPPPHRVVVYPLTQRSAQTLPEDGLLVNHFPLRIGRAPGTDDPEGLDLNDLWLIDHKPFHVSRNHCSIDLDDAGRVYVRDRGSHSGCQVNEHHIGGKAVARDAELHPGHNVLIVGGLLSPYQFRVAIDEPD